MKRLRFKRQKHLIAHWLKRLNIRRRRRPEPPEPPENWAERVQMRLKGLIK